MMIIAELTDYKIHLKKALNKMKNINKPHYHFLIETFGLFLGIVSRINFLQLGRYGVKNEQYYRSHFEQDFNFLELNKNLIQDNCTDNLTIAFDPCYINKSGKSTPYLDWFWSGTAKSTKWGLEIGGLADIDNSNNTALHLEAIQTIKSPEINMIDYYAAIITSRKEVLKDLSKYIVVDAYFSKYSFVSQMYKAGFETISRLRVDAVLQYAFCGEQKTGRGRPKTFDGKINYQSIDLNHFITVSELEKEKIYTAKVYCKSLKKWIIVVLVYTLKKGVWKHKTFFSTDLDLAPTTILTYYKNRFQIEFLYRDSKQFTALNQCQARSKKKLHNHFNIALTTVNLAKITHWLSIEKCERMAFSMSDVKTMYSNDLHLNRFIKVFGIYPKSTKNKKVINELRAFGKIAA